MTTPSSPASPSGPPAGSPPASLPLRLLTAWALLALAGVIIFFSFLTWIFPSSEVDLLGRFRVEGFTGLTVLVAPLLALLVAVRVGPVLPEARLVGLVALIEYAAALLLGTLAFLITLAGQFDDLGQGIYAFGGVLQAVGDILGTLLRLALLALAALWTYQLFTRIGGTLPQVNVHSE